MWIWKAETPARVPAGARISAGNSGSVARSLPISALTEVKRSPVSCMPSPESPAKRMITRSRSWTSCVRSTVSDTSSPSGATTVSRPGATVPTRRVGSGDGDPRVEVDVLDGVEQLDALARGALEGLAARDEAHPPGPLVDDRGRDGLGHVGLALGLAAPVDEAGAAHVAVGDLPAGEVDRVVGGELFVDELRG